ncbi:MAG: enterochelin esterase [Proteobacteria bacterium]|nr:MAG: enterochelin esterase [Pseudomonadota bacterium]
MSVFNHKISHPKGQITSFPVHSALLKGNALGDPHQRTLTVYLPPSYDSSQSYPVMFYLAAYSNSGLGVTGWRNFGESIPERLDRLIGQQKIGPVIMVFPDCFTSLGGNQYLDSAGVGLYASHVHQELIPFVESRLAVKSGAQHRAVLGKSSGGFAAIRFAMDFPGFWGAIANHSGDAGFDLLYRRDFPVVADVLAEFNGDIQKFVKRFWRSKKIMGSHIMALMHICLAATYDPQMDGIRLPFDLHTCELDEQAWSHWLKHDPLHCVDDAVKALSALNGLYMDCGYRDQFYIHYGMRALAQKLEKHKITHIYEEFNGTHSGIDYRLDESLPFLYEKIQ